MSAQTANAREPAAPPVVVGRYRVERLLGQGGFGQVYLARDELLDRLVAVKIPHRDLIARAEAYLAEARDLARLDHPGIVPVYDVGSSGDYPYFIVSKYIDGIDLATRLKRSPLPLAEAVELLARVADAVHAAHLRGLVHRDIKPGNILVDRAGKPFVADFGVALRESEVGKGPRYAGTPMYMSPEQARGEGHRVDGRSDIFSLGIVLYELLTATWPFKADTNEELWELIIAADPRPPRQINDSIPPRLDRICLKALAKRTGDRYSTAHDFAEELRSVLEELSNASPSPIVGPTPLGALATPVTPRVTVVPKGLRSFDADDAEFFLDLLPGPRDSHGLPEAVRFWKSRIEQTDSEQSFHVGFLYGPSGCGKSSLVKAGLLPRLASHVTPIYLEATPDLEVRLRQRIGRACPSLSRATSLPWALAAIRRGEAGRVSGKILIVLDQFEQWLHAHRDGAGTDLVRALRQCDGDRLQCIVLVRDDFWMMATRFMQNLEIRVVEGENAASVDLFPAAHARKVLTAFGQAFGALPPRSVDFTPARRAFLDGAVAGLAQDGWVAPIRLAVFAEMVKQREWSGDVLRELGGTVGIGVRFLDESFTAATAPPERRLHQAAVRAILAELLPASGANIRGAAKSRYELMAAAEYLLAPMVFEDLMRILIRETRLLTPTADDGETQPPNALDQRYQLTHDYLVPAIREWLARQQQGTRRGRAELRLAERTALWSSKPEARQLPSLAECLAIRWRTRPGRWTTAEQHMMRAATRRHFVGLARLAVAVGVIALTVLFVLGRFSEERMTARGEETVRRLLEANVAAAPRIVEELAPLRRWAEPRLEQIATDPAARPDHRLRARLALLPTDPRHRDDLRDAMLRPEADPAEVIVLRDALAPYAAEITADLWTRSEGGDPKARFHAITALATYDPDNPRWEKVGRWAAEQLVAQPSLLLPSWVAAFRPVKEQLTPHLLSLAAQPGVAGVTAEVIADYAADRPDVLARALAAAPPAPFPTFFDRLQLHGDRAVAALRAVPTADPPAGEFLGAEEAGRRANVALALFRLGSAERLSSSLQPSRDPLVRSAIIDRCATVECDPATLVARLEKEPDAGVRAALWLALGGYGEPALPKSKRAELAPRLLAVHREDGSAAVHGATEWLLKRWGIPERGPLRSAVAKPGNPEREWSVSKTGVTMVHLAGPVTFMMGNPIDSPARKDDDAARPMTLDASFEIGATEVTVRLFREFLGQEYGERKSRHAAWRQPGSLDCAVMRVTWYEAAHFCNWLSDREGIPPDQWCYRPDDDGAYTAGMKIVPGFRKLKGYRLPTECEWEYACRGGAATSQCYGQGPGLLPRYAWFLGNGNERTEPVGLLLPNAYGLFDVHGNASEWCHNPVYELGHPGLNADDGEVVGNEVFRAVRGSHYLSNAHSVQSFRRFGDRPSFAEGGGFRLARSRP